jgi:hypothetical protein
MSDPRIFEISRTLTATGLEERWGPFQDSLVRRFSEFAERGIGQSSMAAHAIRGLCGAEARAAVQLAWQNLWRTALNVGVEPSGGLAAELKAAIRAQTEEHYRKIGETQEDYERRIGSAGDQLWKARELALAQVDAEVDLAVASLERRAAREGGSVYQFYAPVGAVVSGSGASASVVQNIGGQEKAELIGALDRILEAITRAEELRDQPKEDLIDLVREARGELDRPKPNGLRLASVLVGVGQAVQTIGSVDSAYQALKAAAALAGLQLP